MFKESKDKDRKGGESDVEQGQVDPIVQSLGWPAVEERVEKLGGETRHVLVEEILKIKKIWGECRYPSIKPGLKGNRSCYTSAYT